EHRFGAEVLDTLQVVQNEVAETVADAHRHQTTPGRRWPARSRLFRGSLFRGCLLRGCLLRDALCRDRLVRTLLRWDLLLNRYRESLGGIVTKLRLKPPSASLQGGSANLRY